MQLDSDCILVDLTVIGENNGVRWFALGRSGVHFGTCYMSSCGLMDILV